MSTAINFPSVVPGEGFNALMNAAYSEFLANQQRNAQAYEIWKRSRAQREEAGAQDMRERQLAYKQARQATGPRMASEPARPVARVGSETPTRSLMSTKAALDALQSRDPWAGRAYGQAQGQEYFNLPAALAINTGQPFENGFDVYSKLMAGSRDVDPRSAALYGSRGGWGQGY